MKQKRILQELQASDMFDGQLTLQPMQGSTINKSYKLMCDDRPYFLKTFELNHFTPTDRQALYMLQTELADAGKAPKPHYLACNHDFQVEDWINHTALAKADVSKAEKIRTLAQTLWEIHQLPTFALSIDLPADWLMYMEMAGLTPDQLLLDKLEYCKQLWLESHQHDQVLCHNDLAMEHIAFGSPAVVFDWEYAACGSRFFDLAACSSINKLTPGELEQLIADYSELSAIPVKEVSEQTADQVPVVELTNELWYAAVGLPVHQQSA